MQQREINSFYNPAAVAGFSLLGVMISRSMFDMN